MKSYVYLFLICLLIGPLSSFGQIIAPKPPANQIRNTFAPTPGYSIGEAVFVNPMADKDAINWNIKISHKGGLDHAIDLEDELAVLKAEKTGSKIAAEELNGGPISEERSVVGVEPVVLATFEDVTDTGTPPDNDMAISDNGYIVSVVNSSISYLNVDGTAILSDYPFTNLVSGLNVSNFLFDPKVIYDPVEDRFILVILAGSSPGSSTVVVGFSVSENPSEGWNFYTFNGAAFDGNWFDFPNVGISTHDLVITGNLFSENDNFQQSLVMQIDKSDGYAGVDVDWEFFNNVSNGAGNNAFTIVPASHGFDDEYGPGMFMVSNNSFQGNQIYFYEITDSVNADQNMINVFAINTPFYDAPGNGLQLNSNATIGTGDCRIKNAYYANGKVVFAFDYDGSGGYSAIRVHRLDVSSLSIQTANHSIPQNDIGYPTVIPFGLDSLTEDIMIGYLQTSSSIYPQIGAISLGDDNIFGPSIVVKVGESAITSLGSNNTQRWGDYSGGGRRHNSTYRNAWFVGCYGQSSDYGNWIVELSDAPNGLAPVGDFEGSPRVGEVPVNVIFNDLSFNGVEDYEWTFEGGNPATSTENNPFVTYADPGKFDVRLIVSNAFGSDTIFKEEYINARLLPLSDYEADVTLGEAPLTVNFTNLSSNGETYTWAFPGGNPSLVMEEIPPAVVYTEPGVYDTNLTVQNSSGTDFDIRFGYIVVEEATSTSELEVDELKVYPNPIVDIFSVSFFVPTRELVDISLVDVTGRTVKHLFHDRAKGGNNVFSFNKNALGAGIYFLIIKNKDQKTIKNEKIIIGQ